MSTNHKVSSFTPSEYTPLFAYMAYLGSNPTEEEVEALKWQNEKLEEFSKRGWKLVGQMGQCTVCGSKHRWGSCWKHAPTNEVIFVGHICESKYGLYSNRIDKDAKALRMRLERARKAQETRARNEMTYQTNLLDNPGLEEAFECEHYIVQNIKNSARSYKLSGKQIRLVFKIAGEMEEKKEEKLAIVPVTDKRIEVTGQVLGMKEVENPYGYQTKIVVKVCSGDGYYKLYGTCPSKLSYVKRGSTISFFAKITVSKDDKSFGFFSRPTKAKEIVTGGIAKKIVDNSNCDLNKFDRIINEYNCEHSYGEVNQVNVYHFSDGTKAFDNGNTCWYEK
jgi:hypothetical protein